MGYVQKVEDREGSGLDATSYGIISTWQGGEGKRKNTKLKGKLEIGKLE